MHAFAQIYTVTFHPLSLKYILALISHQIKQFCINKNFVISFFPGFTISDNESHLGQHNGDTKPKRMRTSFKHHQLRAMKAYFAMNHNPDAKDLKQLSQKTGLSKRVLQVWFQNARAKYRRTVCNPQAQDLSPESQDQASPVSAILEAGIV